MFSCRTATRFLGLLNAILKGQKLEQEIDLDEPQAGAASLNF